MDIFETKQQEGAIAEFGSTIKWGMALLDRKAREAYRNTWAQCISALHVANVLGTTTYAVLIRRSMLMETPASLFGRIRRKELRYVAGSWYGRKANFLAVIATSLNKVQGEEPGLQLVWNRIIVNEQIHAPSLWAMVVLNSVERRSANRLKVTDQRVIGNRELNHVATSQEKWFIDVAMYCWWNMDRCS